MRRADADVLKIPFRDALGAEFVDYYVHIKNAEIERFQTEVSEWKQREYFEMF